MHKKFFVAAIITALSLLLSSQHTHAQSNADERPFELGAQFSVLRNSDARAFAPLDPVICAAPFPFCPPPFPPIDRADATEPGFGGRIGYNISGNFAIEAEVSFFPRDRILEGGRKTQGLFGVKAGKHFEKVGVFGKARPGFLYASQGDLRPKPNTVCPAVFPPPAGCFEGTGQTNFAFDIGGVIELYPTKRTIIRFDAGDTIVRYEERAIAVSSTRFPGGIVINVPADTTHNFQGSIGIGFRF